MSGSAAESSSKSPHSLSSPASHLHHHHHQPSDFAQEFRWRYPQAYVSHSFSGSPGSAASESDNTPLSSFSSYHSAAAPQHPPVYPTIRRSAFLDNLLNPEAPSRTAGGEPSFVPPPLNPEPRPHIHGYPSQPAPFRQLPSLPTPHPSASHSNSLHPATLSSGNTTSPASMFGTRSQTRGGYVDLTDSSPVTANRYPKRRASREEGTHLVSAGPSKKRRRTSHSDGVNAIGLIDSVPGPSDLNRALQKQNTDAIKSQERPEEKPLRLSNLTCVICMDKPTDLTATSCGHVFCHTCLMEALMASEKRSGDRPGELRKSQCPVCRKGINRFKASDVIPLLLKKGLSTQPRRAGTANSAQGGS